MAAISPNELKQRVAVIKRFKELLKSQRDRFGSYLDTLDRQKEVIERGSADDLLQHVELEEKIVADIFSMQKVIEPLEEMYYSAKAHTPDQERITDGEEVSGLKNALDSLRAEAVVRSERNREMLTKRMAELRSEIKTLRGNPYARSLGGNTAPPTQIDIKG
ncbi:MAG: flagellar protein FlgN [Treponema sp.]|nr:flagellar protein FlgN [Treponema sp.]